ncbi:MAG TPA: BTAD domain-containing putative transcriptional regulator [Trebonia sp.]|nr:BTAD domain-containing putative transcriptional regulator [Trebonia sp.]
MRIGLLGPFEVRTDDGVLADVPGARLRGLLTALALEAGRAVPRGTLVDWIWGERPPADAVNALQRLVSRLRKALPDGTIEGLADGYRLTAEPDAVDAVRFELLVGQARGDDGPRRVRRLREALGLWRGAALQGVGLQESAAFDAAVTRLEGLRLTALEDRFDAEVSLGFSPGHGGELVSDLTDLVAAHPVRERLVAALLRALVATGRDTEALLVYERTRETLADTLGVDPSPELSALHVALLRGELRRDGLPPGTPVRGAQGPGGGEPGQHSRKTNVRAELTSFVGRETDVGAVRGLVGGHRLTTLIGPGGSGKTRLATETARMLLDDLPDGAWLVELAPTGPDGDVAQPALDALGLRDALLGADQNADLTDRLIAAIREREALLILDNCEHVIELAAAFAHRVLGECRRLRILATSREPLGITGEALWRVAPLGLPAGNDSQAEIESSPAVRLLRDRAGAVRGELAADAQALPVMARVCRAVDGIPLAIELAAARLRTMSLDQLARRLDDRFSLLTGGSRTALPRHRTLRAVIDWSWELLTDAERITLRRLSVFSGGVSLEAAGRVCAGDQAGPDQVLEVLTSLAEKSLLLTGTGDAPRYRMLGTIREYAASRLAEAGEAELARQAHLAWFTELAETAEPHLRRAEQLEWLATLAAEHDNIAAAMRGALAAGEAHAAMRLAAAAGWYWWLSGHMAEGMELITAATETPGEVPDEIRAMAYAIVVHFVSFGRGDERRFQEWVHKAYQFSRRLPAGRLGHPPLRIVAALERMLREPSDVLRAWESLLDDEDSWVRALARVQLGKMRIVLGQGGWDADAYLETALAEFRALGERFGMWFALTELADRIATRGEFARACAHYEAAITAFTEVGAIEDVIRMRARQAQLYWLLGDQDASAAAIGEAERCAERVTWPEALAELALAQAELARWAGDAAEARRQLDTAVAMLGDKAEQPSFRAVTHDLLGYLADDPGEARTQRAAACQAAAESAYAPLIAKVIVGVADLALRRDSGTQAARLLAASAGVLGLPDRSNPDAARIEAETRRCLGDATFAEATREGTQASWSELAEATLAC